MVLAEELSNPAVRVLFTIKSPEEQEAIVEDIKAELMERLWIDAVWAAAMEAEAPRLVVGGLLH